MTVKYNSFLFALIYSLDYILIFHSLTLNIDVVKKPYIKVNIGNCNFKYTDLDKNFLRI